MVTEAGRLDGRNSDLASTFRNREKQCRKTGAVSVVADNVTSRCIAMRHWLCKLSFSLNAGFRPEAEPWDEDSDSDSDESDDADEADELLRLMV